MFLVFEFIIKDGDNVKREYTIKNYYKRIFWRVVSIPLVLIITVSMCLILYQYEQEQMQELNNANDTVMGILENEVEEYSLALSNLVVANSGQVIKLLHLYNTSTGTERYSYGQELEYMYNIGYVQLSALVATEFYFEDGSKYGFEYDHIVGKTFIEDTTWYLESMKNPDKVRVNVMSNDLIIGRNAATVFDNLFVFSIALDSLGAGNTLEMGVMCIESDALTYITSASDWTKDIYIYLVDSEGNILSSSSELYMEEAQEISATNQCSDNSISFVTNKLARNGWSVITLADDSGSQIVYQNIILMMSISIGIVFLFLYLFLNKLLNNIIEPINQLSATMKNVSDTSKLEKSEVTEIYEIAMIENTYNQMVDDIEELITTNRIQEEEKHAEEMKVLELQLNPHFLSNTLTSIRFMAIVAKFESIQKMTESLMNILEVSFRSADRFHKLKDELLLVESYLYIMLIRYANNFEISYDIDDNIENFLVPKLILQPFLENSITHGFEGIEDIGELLITIKKKDDGLHISIKDNGSGIPKEQIKDILIKEPINGKHIGVANINKRLKLYYGENYGIEIESEEYSYTIMKFIIPYSEE